MSGISDNTGDVNGQKNLKSNSTSRQWELSRLTILCYAPAFLLVILSFWYMLILNLFPNQELVTVFINRQIEQKILENLERETDTPLDTKQQDAEKGLIDEQIITKDADSILVKGYIDGQVREEVQIQAEKVAKAEVNQAKTELETLKNNWTADLFNQIAFAVIFTVASIFAAFAVKDVLTEILKDQEKDRIKQDLKRDLEVYITDDLLMAQIKSQTRKLDYKLEKIEAYTYWLEHELLTTKIIQALNDAKTYNLSETQKNNPNKDTLHILNRLLTRSQHTLTKASEFLEGKHHNLLKEGERKIFEQNIKSAKFNSPLEQKLLQKVDTKRKSATELKQQPNLEEETVKQLFDNILEVQIALLFTTLNKLPEKDENFINELKKTLYRLATESIDNSVVDNIQNMELDPFDFS